MHGLLRLSSFWRWVAHFHSASPFIAIQGSSASVCPSVVPERLAPQHHMQLEVVNNIGIKELESLPISLQLSGIMRHWADRYTWWYSGCTEPESWCTMHVVYQSILQRTNPDYSEWWGHSGHPGSAADKFLCIPSSSTTQHTIYDHFGIIMHCAVQMTLSYPPFPLHSSEYSTFTGVLVCRDSLTVLLFAQWLLLRVVKWAAAHVHGAKYNPDLITHDVRPSQP